jgi:hypothetical protein
MRLDSTRDTLMAAMQESMSAFLKSRVVDRGLVDPANLPLEQLQVGVLRLVTRGGGNFANYQGREGELGTVRFTVLGFIQVPEKSAKVEVEQAELALLEDVLDWAGPRQQRSPPLDCIYPLEYTQSSGLEHPIGWIALSMEARNV